MTDYISREAAKEAVVRAVGKGYSPFNAIVMLPAADVRPVVKARWKPVMCASNPNIQDRDEWYGQLFDCDKCGWTMIGKSNFCPNCGASMLNEEKQT